MLKIREGYYAQNLEKEECKTCCKEFIVGYEDKISQKSSNLHCPFCGSKNTCWSSRTEDKDIEEIEEILGCLHLYKEVEE